MARFTLLLRTPKSVNTQQAGFENLAGEAQKLEGGGHPTVCTSKTREENRDR
jgi:hypothetical protein